MLKHVSVSPWRGRADSVSLASSGGASSCGSGSPTPGHTPPPSRASSCASLAPLTALSSFSPADAASQQAMYSRQGPVERVARALQCTCNPQRGENRVLGDVTDRGNIRIFPLLSVGFHERTILFLENEEDGKYIFRGPEILVTFTAEILPSTFAAMTASALQDAPISIENSVSRCTQRVLWQTVFVFPLQKLKRKILSRDSKNMLWAVAGISSRSIENRGMFGISDPGKPEAVEDNPPWSTLSPYGCRNSSQVCALCMRLNRRATLRARQEEHRRLEVEQPSMLTSTRGGRMYFGTPCVNSCVGFLASGHRSVDTDGYLLVQKFPYPAQGCPLTIAQTTIKVYANCLRADIEYKTLCITYETTCREIVQNLLNKYRMRLRDPRLFYLTMEVTVRRPNVRTVLPLDEDSRPAVLQSCHPRGDSRGSCPRRFAQIFNGSRAMCTYVLSESSTTVGSPSRLVRKGVGVLNFKRAARVRGKERLDSEDRSFCRMVEERLEVKAVFMVARNFRRSSPVTTICTGFTDVFLLQILVEDTPRGTCENIRQRAHVRTSFYVILLCYALLSSAILSSPLYLLQSKYKSLLVSEQTTVDELIQMLLSCYSSKERVEQFSLYEVCEGEEYQRKLHPDDSPLKVTQRWTSADRHLRIRRNPDYNPHRRKSMWASDSSISMAMSRLNLHGSHQAHYNQGNDNNNHLSLYQHKDASSINNNNNIHKIDQHHLSLGSLNQQPRIVVPHATQLPQLQIPRVQQLPQSVPSTPISSKHITASSYADYENYLVLSEVGSNLLRFVSSELDFGKIYPRVG
ncbi:hypothetical protein WN48_01200 [Eufriesea mexicana]|nr:hypothetical protein WN48_01200 [Eufriesea mexicana]